MKRSMKFASVSISALALIAGASLAAAQPPKEQAPKAQPSKVEPPKEQPAAPAMPEMQLPPGWTMEDMQACMAAGEPGEKQLRLTREAGTWYGKGHVWMGPGGEGAPAECQMKITSIMDGRYVQLEMKGDMPGMGPYHGMGINAYDNVSGEFVGTWIDSHSTGILNGKGVMSEDGKAMTWKHVYNCPITKKPTIMRQVERVTGPDTKSMEMFGNDPKSGKEYKLMAYEFTRQP